MSALACENCPYCYCAEDDVYPHCQFESMGEWDPAPCEYEDNEEDYEV